MTTIYWYSFEQFVCSEKRSVFALKRAVLIRVNVTQHLLPNRLFDIN